jgi:hypothetical protein
MGICRGRDRFEAEVVYFPAFHVSGDMYDLNNHFACTDRETAEEIARKIRFEKRKRAFVVPVKMGQNWVEAFNEAKADYLAKR